MIAKSEQPDLRRRALRVPIPVVIALSLIAIFVVSFGVMQLSWRSIVPVDAAIPQCASSAGTNTSAECRTAYNMKMREYRAYLYRFTTEHRASVYYWQRFSTVVSFVLVTSIIITGLGLAYLEFQKGRGGVTTFKFSGEGVEISSEIIGLIILVISLAFTYLYLDKVYPISRGSAALEQTEAAPADSAEAASASAGAPAASD